MTQEKIIEENRGKVVQGSACIGRPRHNMKYKIEEIFLNWRRTVWSENIWQYMTRMRKMRIKLVETPHQAIFIKAEVFSSSSYDLLKWDLVIAYQTRYQNNWDENETPTQNYEGTREDVKHKSIIQSVKMV